MLQVGKLSRQKQLLRQNEYNKIELLVLAMEYFERNNNTDAFIVNTLRCCTSDCTAVSCCTDGRFASLLPSLCKRRRLFMRSHCTVYSLQSTVYTYLSGLCMQTQTSANTRTNRTFKVHVIHPLLLASNFNKHAYERTETLKSIPNSYIVMLSNESQFEHTNRIRTMTLPHCELLTGDIDLYTRKCFFGNLLSLDVLLVQSLHYTTYCNKTLFMFRLESRKNSSALIKCAMGDKVQVVHE